MSCRSGDRVVWQQYAVGLPTPIGLFVVDIRNNEILARAAEGCIVRSAAKLPWHPGFAFVVSAPPDRRGLGVVSPDGESALASPVVEADGVAGHPVKRLLATTDHRSIVVLSVDDPSRPEVEVVVPPTSFEDALTSLTQVYPCGWVAEDGKLLVGAEYSRGTLPAFDEDALDREDRWWAVAPNGEVAPFSPPGVSEQSFPNGLFELIYRNQAGLWLYAGGGPHGRRLSAYRGERCVWSRDAVWDFIEASPDGKELLVGMGCEYLLVNLVTGEETVCNLPYYSEYPAWSA